MGRATRCTAAWGTVRPQIAPQMDLWTCGGPVLKPLERVRQRSDNGASSLFTLGWVDQVHMCVFAGISGYVSASYYRQFEGTKWVTNLLLTCSVFCGPLLGMFAINNTVAIVYGVSRAGITHGGAGALDG